MTKTVGHIHCYDNPAVWSFSVPKPILSNSNKIVVPMACHTTVNFVTSTLVSLPVIFRIFVRRIYLLCDRLNNVCELLVLYFAFFWNIKYILQYLVIEPSVLVYIFTENQQMHQNDHCILMFSQTLLHVSANHHQGAYMIITSYLYVSVHYRKNSGISSEIAPLVVFHNSPLLPAAVNHIYLYP
jgi:hypothetical protein